MAEPTNTGTNAIVNAINLSSQNTINGFTAASENLKDEISELSDNIDSQINDLSQSIENSQPSEEERSEEKRDKIKARLLQMGILGTIAAGIYDIPKFINTSIDKSKGLWNIAAGSELVENISKLTGTILSPVKAVADKIAAPILKNAGKVGLLAAGVFAAVEGVKGAFEGVKRAGEIFGEENVDISEKISAGVGGFVEGIAQAPGTLLEMLGMEELAKKYREFIDKFNITENVALFVNKFLDPTIDALKEFLEPLKEFLKPLGPIFKRIGNFIKTEIVPHILPVLEQVYDFFSNIIGGVFEKIREVGFFQKLEEMLLSIGNVITDIWTKIDKSGIIPRIKTFFEETIIGGFGKIIEIATIVFGKVSEGLEAARPTIDKIVGIIMGIVDFLMPILKTVAIDVLLPAIKLTLGGILDLLGWVGGGLLKLLNPILEWIQSKFPQGEGGMAGLGQKIADGIKNFFDGIFGFFENLSIESIISKISNFGQIITDGFNNIWESATTKFAEVVTQIKNTLIQWIRKIPLMEKFGMTDEEKVDVDRREQIRKDIEGYASTFSINPFGESQKKQMQDTQNIQGILETTSREDIAALLQGNKLNENARKELAHLFNENKQLYEEIKTAKDQLNATSINHVSTQNNHTSTGIAVQKEVANKVLAASEVH